MLDKKINVLVSNDDGINAQGIHELVKALSRYANVYVAAPHVQRSAAGHSITIRGELEVVEKEFEHAELAYEITGTPADCVKLGVLLLTEGQSYSQKGITWFKGLNTNNKIIVGCVAMFVVILLICFIGAATEKDENQEPTIAETTIEYVSDTTDKQTTTETTVVETTEETTKVPTTEETSVEESAEEFTTEIETEAVVEVVEDEPETEQIEYTTEKKSGKTVYITPTGEKYHCSSACAGKNAMARDYDDVEGVYDPCKKCAY